MNETRMDVKTFPTVAPLKNVQLCMEALEHVMTRKNYQPGMASFYGPAGWGKTQAAIYAYNKLKAYYIECKKVFTQKSFLQELLKEMGIPPEKTMYAMFNQVVDCLCDSNVPLIIDEFDYLVDKGLIDIVRDISDSSQGSTILLIGEENLPTKVKKEERFYRRVLDWKKAQPISLTDAAHLKMLYHPTLEISEDLIVQIHEKAQGSAGELCNMLADVQEYAREDGVDCMDLKQLGGRSLRPTMPEQRRRK